MSCRAVRTESTLFGIASIPVVKILFSTAFFKVLFEELRLDAKLPSKSRLAKTSVNNQTSTSESVLIQLAPFHPLPGIVLEYRQVCYRTIGSCSGWRFKMKGKRYLTQQLLFNPTS